MIARRLRTLAPLFAVALAACGSGAATPPASLDDELAVSARDVDPLLAAAVQDPIMSDPGLSTRSNADAIRPPTQPYAAPVPMTDVAAGPPADDGALTSVPAAAQGACRACAVARDAITLAALAARQDDPRLKRCAVSLRYAAGWANRLPADLPLYGGARIVEAAGADDNGCGLRAVSFTTRQPVGRMLDWYYTQATKAGYASVHGADDSGHVLTGSRSRDGAAYVAVVREGSGGGSEIDLLVNG